MEKVSVVIDIGMTNKKVAIYDRNLRMLDAVSRKFDPIMVEGLETHDLAGMEAWFLDALAQFARRFPIGAIAVSTHGATMVCVGPDGECCAPCVYYTHEPGEDFHRRFYALAGDRRELQASTATPPLSAMINPSKGIFFLKERFPEAFARSVRVLNYPQYWGFRLTGESGAEGTYTGSHSYLWDWKTGRYSSVADKLGLTGLMPFPLRDSWEILGTVSPRIAECAGLARDVLVTMGIHDSNASLLPHLAKAKGKDFILNSTGTWCVLMHPQESYGFARDELGKVVFFNLSAYNKPVKTAIFLGGMEYEAWAKAIAFSSGLAPDYVLPEPTEEDYRAVVEERSNFILPELVPGSGQFPGSVSRAVQDGSAFPLCGIEEGRRPASFMKEARRALATLNLSLAIQTLVALERAGLGAETEVYTEGGFRKNSGYNALLASALNGPSGGRAYLTDISEATALGAAMTATAALEATTPESLGDRFAVEYKEVMPMAALGDFDGYRDAWLALAADKGGGA